jgi:hypothetical protein
VNMIQPYMIKKYILCVTNYFAMQHLFYHNPNQWPVFIQQNDLNTGLFLRTCLGGGHLQKGTKLY